MKTPALACGGLARYDDVVRAALFLLIPTFAFAQTPASYAEHEQERQAIEQRFSSAQAPDLAWGATLAANYGQAEFVPRIIGLLRHPELLVRIAALDALIRLGADVDDASLAELASGRHFDAAMILAWKHLSQHTGLLSRLLDSLRSDHQWAILNSLLLSSLPSGYAARLLREWNYEVTLSVTDAVAGPGMGTGMSWSCGGGSSDPRYPPFREYWISSGTAGPGDTVMLTGTHPLSYSIGSCPRPEIISRSSFTLDYLRQMARSVAEPPSGQVVFHDPTQYERDVEIFRGQVRGYLSELRAALIRAGRMGAEEPAEPRVSIRVSDQRKDKTVALPKIREVVP